MALYFECRINKNALLQTVFFLAILSTCVFMVVKKISVDFFVLNSNLQTIILKSRNPSYQWGNS